MGKFSLTFLRFTGLSAVFIVMLVVVVAELTSFKHFFNSMDTEANAPKVEFNNFKSYKNATSDEQTNNTDDLLQKQKQALFQKQFFEQYKEIFNNISSYAKATNQRTVNDRGLEEYLFDKASRYNYDLRTSYIKQLSVESKNLEAYASELKNNANNKAIEWTDFLNWFSYDFETQLQEEEARVAANTMTEDASKAELLHLMEKSLMVLISAIMMLFLIKIEANTRKEVIVQDDDTTETEEKTS